MLLGVKKVKIGSQSPKTEFVLGSFMGIKKKYTFGGQNGENKP
jgi:hypothetical protein